MPRKKTTEVIKETVPKVTKGETTQEFVNEQGQTVIKTYDANGSVIKKVIK